MNTSNSREKRPREPNESDLYIDSKRNSNYNSSNSGNRNSNYSSSHDGSPRFANQRSSSGGSGQRDYNASRSSRGGRTPDYHSSRGSNSDRYDGSSRSRNTPSQSPMLTHRSSSGGSDSDNRSSSLHATPSSSSKFSHVHTPQSDRKPPSSHLMLSRSVSADVSRKPPLPQRPALSDSHASERGSLSSATPSRHPPPRLSRSVSTPAAAGQKSPSTSPRARVLTPSAGRPFKSSYLNESLVATIQDYVKMMDFACFSSLHKLGVDCPTKGFTPLQEIFEQVDNERVAAAKQAATAAPASEQKSRSLHDKRSDDVAYTTPVHSSRKHESNPRVPPDSGQTGEGSVHGSAHAQAQPQVVRKRVSRFSDRPPPPSTAPHI
mmetsp:Transcript_3243/g.5717  ORF Transcript_3243/g.5717 Transcript_3243/m.5717 type:complete len:377 (-) Transcript_3243:63-1193(-)